jgi:hypothetical protein
MHNRLIIGALLGFIVLMPINGWAGKPVDKHDCRAEKGGRFVCERGPLAGKSFASRKAMMEAVSAGSPSDVGQTGSEKAAGSKSGKAKAHKKH